MFDSYWENLHQTEDWLREVPESFLMFYKKNYEGKKGLNFLDIGCGTGGISTHLGILGHNVVALDGSKTAVKKTKQLVEVNNLTTVSFVVADICRVNFKPESFDCLVDNVTLQTLPLEEFKQIIKTVVNWLKPGGRFYTKTATKPYNYFRKEAPVRFSTVEDLMSLYTGFYPDFGLIEYGFLNNGDKVTHFVLDFRKSNDKNS